MDNTQQLKPDRKGFAIASFVLGIVPIILAFGVVVGWIMGLGWLKDLFLFPFKIIGYLFALIYPTDPYVLLILLPAFPLAGIFLGILGGRMSSKKTLAFLGIIMNIIIILAYISMLKNVTIHRK